MSRPSRGAVSLGQWLVAVVAALGAFLAPGSSVLCIAAGSHVSLEGLLESCCTGSRECEADAGHLADPGHTDEVAVICPGDRCCSGCIDLLVDVTTLKSKRLLLEAPVPELLEVLTADRAQRAFGSLGPWRHSVCSTVLHLKLVAAVVLLT